MGRIIRLDAQGWMEERDFYDAIWDAICDPRAMRLPMPSNLNALEEAMVYSPEMVFVQPPYLIEITGVASLPYPVRTEIELAAKVITNLGHDDGVSIIVKS